CPFPPPVHAAILTYSLHDALPIYACDHSHSYSAGPGPTPPIGKRHSLASIPPVSATAQSMDAPRCPAIIFCAPTVVRRRCGAGGWWMSGFRASVENLAAAQKSSRGVSLYSRWVNRPFGRVLAASAHQLGMSPNAVTAVSAATTGAALLLLIMVRPQPWLGPAVALLLVAGFALDSADGQLARLTGRSSPVGEWLDHVVDAAKMVCVHGAVLVAGHRFWSTSEAWLLVPLAFQV